MEKTNKLPLDGWRIAVLMGGPGSEREVSLRSGQAVEVALTEAGAKVHGVDVRDRHFDLPPEIDLAFNVIHGTFGEDGELQRILERRGVPYTGAGVESSRVAFDKVASKQHFVEAGVPTPDYELINLRAGMRPGFELPFVVKPPREGSSVGVHLVRAPEQLEPALAEVREYADEILVEQLVEGRELTVGVLGDQALPVIWIQTREGFYDFRNKYPWMGGGGGTEYHVPAPLSPDVTKQVQQVALQAMTALGVEVYGRVDIILDNDNSPSVLEINTIPGMTESSLLPKAAAAVGISFPALCAEIANLSRNIERRKET